MKEPLADFSDLIESCVERLRIPIFWFPLPAFISLGLCMVLYVQIQYGFNPMRGLELSFPEAQGEEIQETSIMYSVFLHEDELVLINQSRRAIVLPKAIKSDNELIDFTKDLEKQIQKKLVDGIVARRITGAELTVIFMIDDSLRYAHIRPILQALAIVKVSNYGFAVRPSPPDDEGESRG